MKTEPFVRLSDLRREVDNVPDVRAQTIARLLLYIAERVSTQRPRKDHLLDVHALVGEDIDALILARDATSITHAPRRIRQVLERIAVKQSRTSE